MRTPRVVQENLSRFLMVASGCIEDLVILPQLCAACVRTESHFTEALFTYGQPRGVLKLSPCSVVSTY